MGSIQSLLMVVLKLLNKGLRNERGGVEIILFSLIAISFSVMAQVITVDLMLQFQHSERVKHHLTLALHDASVEVDKSSLADGILQLEVNAARDRFYLNLAKNMHLDGTMDPLNSSYLFESPIVHELVYIDLENGTLNSLLPGPSNCSLNGSNVECTVVTNPGTAKEAERTVDELLLGPSIVAVIEAPYKRFNLFEVEPVVVAGAEQIRFVKR